MGAAVALVFDMAEVEVLVAQAMEISSTLCLEVAVVELTEAVQVIFDKYIRFFFSNSDFKSKLTFELTFHSKILTKKPSYITTNA